jgi:hemoglobin/transferrin/lactoferrin receptor protein
MRRLSVLLILFCAVLTANAQLITLKDAKTGQPIEMATLESENPRAFTITNTKGQADISAFKGAEKIEIRALGFKPAIKSYALIESKSFIISLLTSEVSLSEVVISASRWSQESKDVPSRISTMPAREIALQNPQTAADLLATSGEVFIQKSQQGGGSPMIRGFSTNRLLYTIDGVRMNTAIFRGGNLQNVISLDPFAIENTEVFFGPGSVIYGSDAIGGVMSFQTLTPIPGGDTDEPLVSGKAVMRYSSANHEKTGHFDINIGWKKWASVTSFTSSDYGDLKMGSHGPDEYLRKFYVIRMDSIDRVITNSDPLVQKPTGYSQINLMQKLRFKPNETWDFQYGFHFSETSSYSRYDRLIETQANGLPQSAVWNYGPQKWMMNLLSVSHRKENILYNEFSLRIAQQYFEESRIDRNFSGGNRFRLRTQQEEVQAFSVNADFEKQLNKDKLYYGVEAIRNDVNSLGSAIDIRNNNAIATPDRYPQSTWNSYAGYINYQRRMSDLLIAQAGVRYSWYSINSDFTRHLEFFPFDFTTSRLSNNAISGSLGAVYSPSESWKLSINASTGFRAPNVDDIGKIFDFAAGDVIVPNTGLKAEYAYNAEINIARVFGELVKLDFSSYYTQLDNALVRREFMVNGQDSIVYNGRLSKVFAIQNAATANVYGFHAGVEIKLPIGFGVSSRYNYQKGNEEMDDGTESRSRHAAPAYGVTRLTYQYQQLRMQLYAMYSAEISYENLNEEEKQKPVLYAKDPEGNPYSPSWFTLNFKAMYQITDNLSVSAGLENITDQRYRPYSSGIVAPGRNFILSFRANF